MSELRGVQKTKGSPDSPLSRDLEKFLQWIRDMLHQLTTSVTHPNTIHLFRKGLYLWLFCTLILYYPIAEHLWGPTSYFLSKTSGGGALLWEKVLDPLSFPWLAPYYKFFIGGQLFFLLMGLLDRWPRLSSIMVCYLNFVLDSKAFDAITGGNILVEIMLVYLVFMSPFASSPSPTAGVGPTTASANGDLPLAKLVGNVVTNFAFYMARLQLVIVYLVSGLAKLNGHLWKEGVALYYVLNTDQFSSPFIQRYLAHNELFIFLGTYMTLIYQLLFPVLVWNRKVRPYLLFIGMLMHLQISLLMGLLDFGFAVMACYLVFYEDGRSKRLLEGLWPQKQLAVPVESLDRTTQNWLLPIRLLNWRKKITIISTRGRGNGDGHVAAIRALPVVSRLPLLLPLVHVMKVLEYFRKRPFKLHGKV